MAKLITGTAEAMGGDVVLVLDRDELTALAVRLPEGYAPGQAVTAERLWGDGHEGEACRVGGVVCPVEIYTPAGTPDQIAGRLGVEVDDLGLTQ